MVSKAQKARKASLDKQVTEEAPVSMELKAKRGARGNPVEEDLLVLTGSVAHLGPRVRRAGPVFLGSLGHMGRMAFLGREVSLG